MSMWRWKSLTRRLQPRLREAKRMFEGSVVSIHIAPAAAETMIAVTDVQAIPGKGLAGDRYCQQKGTLSEPQPDRELTLIESEAIEAFSGETKIEFVAAA